MALENKSEKQLDHLYQETPVILSNKLSLINNRNVYLKLDNGQASGSFKLRGIGHLVYQVNSLALRLNESNSFNFQLNEKSIKKEQIENLISSSGGNAGLAAAYVGKTLKIKTTIVTPNTTSKLVIDDLKSYGADVLVHGDAWDDAHKKALELFHTLKGAFYVPPFDHPLIWEGNSTIIEEAVVQLKGVRPDCVIVSVGGGGLACGVFEAMLRHGWIQAGVKLITVETVGADCFHESVKQGRCVTLSSITSIAKTLGAKKCADRLFALWTEYPDSFVSLRVTDKEAVEACCKFLDDQKALVEPACGASLAVAYNLDKFLGKDKYKNVLVEVCGGTACNLETLLAWKKQFEIE